MGDEGAPYVMRDSFSRDMDGLLRGGGNFWRTMLRYAAALASLDGSRWFTNTHTRNRYSVYVTRGTSYEEAIAAGTYWWSLNLQHQKPGREWTMFGWLEPKEKKDPCAEAMAAYLRCVEGKADGLREGDECVGEVEAYKKCRQLVKEAKRQGAKAVPTGGAAAPTGDKQQSR